MSGTCAPVLQAEQPEFWQQLADNIPQLAWVADSDGSIFWFNKRWYEYTGTTLEESRGWGWRVAHHPDHVDRVADKFASAVRLGQPFEDVFPLRGATGEYRQFLTRAQPIRGADGEITHWFGTNTDVAEQVEAANDLRYATRRLDAVLNNTTMGVFLMDEKQQCVFANAAAEQLTGYRFADMQGRPLHDVIHHKKPDGSHYPLEECPIDRAFPARAQMQGEELFVAPDGSFYPVAFTASPVLDDLGQPVGTVIEAVNIAEQKARDAALLASEEKYRAVFEQAGVGVARVSPEGPFLEINDRYCQILGRSREELLGSGWVEITHPDDLADDVRQVEAMLRGEIQSFAMEKRYLARDGSDIWVHMTVAAERDLHGKIKFFIPVIEDIGERKAAEAALAQSEAQFRTTAEALPGMLFVTDSAGKNSYVNDCFRSFTGRSDADLLGDKWIETLHADDVASAWEIWSEAVRTGRPYEAEYRFLRHDGMWRWHAVRALPVRDDEGTIVQWVGTCTDIHDRRAAEDALKDSEERLRTLFESMDQGFCLLELIDDQSGETVDHRFLLTNPAFERQSGLSNAAGRTVREMVPELEKEWFVRYGRIAKSRQPERFIDHAEPLGRWFDCYAFPIGDPADLQVAVLFTDITAQREQQLALERSEARLRAVIDATPVGLVFAEASGRITGGNNRVEEIIGKPLVSSETVGDYKADYVAYHRDGRQVEAHEYPLAKVLSGESERPQLVCHVQRHDGSLVWVRYVAAPIHDADGTLAGGVVASIDIDREVLLTEGLELEVAKVVAEREAAQEALRQSQKLEAMGQLTGGVAHDFNNLLTPIIGSLDLLQRKQVGDARTQRLIDGALQSAEKAKVLVQRLLAFARRQPLQPTAIDVGRIVAGMADLIGSTSGPRVKVEVAIAPELPPALGDGNQIEMALLNLSVNARDAMPDGGVLTIAARPEEAVNGNPLGLRAQTYVVLSVADTGMGMDEETRRRAIEPFFSTKGVGKGTGLGLSMVHGLAAQLGGALCINSREGLGTSIELWLPVANMAEPDLPQYSEQRTAKGSGVALLVDDEDLVRISTASMLAELGYEVVEAVSAEDALQRLRSGLRPAVLVTDHIMPGMTGTDMAIQLREEWPELPVLIVSGYADVESLTGAFPHLTKPFRQSELAEQLKAAGSSLG